MASLRILTFNWHEAYLCLLAKTGHCFTVVDKEKGGRSGWLHGTRPVPGNFTLLPVGAEAEALQSAHEGRFDLAICHNLKDLADLSGTRIPKIVVFHNRISTEIALFRASGRAAPKKAQYLAQFRSLFDEWTHAVFISPKKQSDAEGIEGRVILPGIDLDEYGGYRGEVARVLRVGNFFTGRDLMLGQTAAVAAVRDLPVTVLGINPEIPGSRLSTSWEDLKEHFRSHRLYLNTTVLEYEDGYNLAMLEAMATGMPVVTTFNDTSPIQDGVNGFISRDLDVLHSRLRLLCLDAELAHAMGQRAQETISGQFPIPHFISAWNQAFHDALRLMPGTGSNQSKASNVLQGWTEPSTQCIPPEAQILLDHSNWSKARPLLEKLAAQHPRSSKLRKALGFVYRSLGRESEAIRAQWAAAKLDPDDEEARRLHLADLVSIAPGVRPENNPEAAALACLCSGKGVDVGCGPNKTHPLAIGVDLVPAGAPGVAGGVKGLKSVADICASGDDLHMFHDGELDYVVSRHNLEHYQDPLRALEEWKRILKPGGILGLVLPDDTNIETIRLDPTHKHVFTPDSLKRLVGYLGSFDIVHVGECLYLWSFTAILQKRGGTAGPYDYHLAVRRAEAERCRLEADRREQAGDPSGSLECRREAAALDPDSAADVRAQIRMLRRLGRLPESEALKGSVSAPSNPLRNGRNSPCSVDGIKALRLNVPAARKRILLSYCSNPMTTGAYVERALRKRHDVLTWGPSVSEEILKYWKMEALAPRVRPTDLGYDSWSPADALRRLAPGWEPDLFLWIESGIQFPIESLSALPCPKACYLIDTHIDLAGDRRVESQLQWARQFDVVFLAQRAYVGRFQSEGLDAHWLPLGCDPEIHRKDAGERSNPVAFVGSLNQQRRIDLIGRLRPLCEVRVERCFLEDMAAVFSQARVVFNNAVSNDLNMRVFEAMAAGALLITDPAPGSGLEEFFTDGEHLGIYRSDDGLVDVVAHWLKDESARSAVARAGQAEVLAHHTYEHRVALMEQVLFASDAEFAQASCAQAAGQLEDIGILARSLMTSRRASAGAKAPESSAGKQDPEAKMARGRILLSTGKQEEARSYFLRWLEDEPSNPLVHIGLGCLALAGGAWDESERRYRSALDLSPRHPKALCGLGLALAGSGREMEATDALIDSLDRESFPVGALKALIRSASAVGRYAEARSAVNRYLEIEPDNSHLLFSSAMLSAMLGENEDALLRLDRLESIDPAYPELHRWRAAWSSTLATHSP